MTLLGLTGCGLYDRLDPSGGKPASPVATPVPSVAASTTTPSVVANAKGAPIETFLTDQVRIPSRLKASALLVDFDSNLEAALFECAVGADRDFQPCPDGDRYDFGPLANGRAYQIRVRAKEVDSGRVDETPLTIAFVADGRAGHEVAAQPKTPPRIPTRAADLPSRSEASFLQVGSFYGVNTEPGYLVTSYATTKTTNESLRSMRIAARADLSSLFGARPCDPLLERERTGPDGLTYCEATPTRDEWHASFGGPLPENHLEIVRDVADLADGAAEKLFVAAFDGERDPTVGRMGIGDTCRDALARGETDVPLVYGFLEASPTREPFTWCQVRDRMGHSWWIGTFSFLLGRALDPGLRGAGMGAARITVIYTASAELGIFSGRQFAARAGDFIAPVLVPIAPAPNP